MSGALHWVRGSRLGFGDRETSPIGTATHSRDSCARYRATSERQQNAVGAKIASEIVARRHGKQGRTVGTAVMADPHRGLRHRLPTRAGLERTVLAEAAARGVDQSRSEHGQLFQPEATCLQGARPVA